MNKPLFVSTVMVMDGTQVVSTFIELPVRKEQKEKPCICCGKPKNHNNSFCSKECCQEHKRK